MNENNHNSCRCSGVLSANSLELAQFNAVVLSQKGMDWVGLFEPTTYAMLKFYKIQESL